LGKKTRVEIKIIEKMFIKSNNSIGVNKDRFVNVGRCKKAL
jgi:hypothetical protein